MFFHGADAPLGGLPMRGLSCYAASHNLQANSGVTWHPRARIHEGDP
jgi:hypothetical protein